MVPTTKSRFKKLEPIHASMEMTKQTPYPIMALVKPNIIPIPRIHILAHTIPNRLAKPPSSTHLT